MTDGSPSEEAGAPGYAVRYLDVPIASESDLRIRALLDRQQYHDPRGLAAAEGISAACWPLFGQVWPSARKLAHLMHSWDIDGKRILEIGCGLALASLVVHRRQGDITASDCHPLARAFLHANLVLNQLPDLPYFNGNWTRTSVELGWFDLIIGSDVLYERCHPEQLAGFLHRHAAPKAEVLIIDPNRGNRAAFNRRMRDFGFALTETRLDEPLHDGSPYRGRLLQFSRDALLV